jgi:hypothetical protein
MNLIQYEKQIDRIGVYDTVCTTCPDQHSLCRQGCAALKSSPQLAEFVLAPTVQTAISQQNTRVAIPNSDSNSFRSIGIRIVETWSMKHCSEQQRDTSKQTYESYLAKALKEILGKNGLSCPPFPTVHTHCSPSSRHLQEILQHMCAYIQQQLQLHLKKKENRINQIRTGLIGCHGTDPFTGVQGG